MTKQRVVHTIVDRLEYGFKAELSFLRSQEAEGWELCGAISYAVVRDSESRTYTRYFFKRPFLPSTT